MIAALRNLFFDAASIWETTSLKEELRKFSIELIRIAKRSAPCSVVCKCSIWDSS